MTIDPMKRGLHRSRVLPYLYCFVLCSSHFVQAGQKQHKETLKGCLTGGRGQFYLTSLDGRLYAVTGNTSALTRYAGKEISILGEADISTQPWPSTRFASSTYSMSRTPA